MSLREIRIHKPLHIAAEKGKEKVVNFLLLQEPQGEHPDLLQKDHEGDTPLHIAAGNFKIFKLMFPANPDITGVRNSKEQTLLHYASGKNCPKVVDFLLKVKGSLKSAKDYTGATPFHFGARSGRYVRGNFHPRELWRGISEAALPDEAIAPPSLVAPSRNISSIILKG